jgi:GNAT superfamily N-acetyltransferase
MDIVLRPYEPTADFDNVYHLWDAALGPRWPIRREDLATMLDPDGIHLLAWVGDRAAGLATGHLDPATGKAGIGAVLVAPDLRRRGIGRALHDALFDALRVAGAARVQLGGGGGPLYFWPGVPQNLPGGRAFFEACGWRFSELACDLTRHLDDYETPPGLLARVQEAGVDIRPVRDDAEAAALLHFETRHFPEWHHFFELTARRGQYRDLLAAWNAEGRVIGSLLLFQAQAAQSADRSVIWQALLGPDMGGLGAVGVAETAREGGIGTALVARASELLKARGVRQAHIGWTHLLQFYGRLGYVPWRSYDMAFWTPDSI